jgi:hypothetical protein
MIPAALVAGALSLWMSWLLYRAITLGQISGTRGGLQVNKSDTPIIFWGVVLLYAVLLLNFLRVLADNLGLHVRL